MHLIWIDLEMTGLEVFGKDQIMEIAIVITDKQLQRQGAEYHAVIHQPKPVLDQMNDWCTEHHGKSGLTAQCLASTKSYHEVEQQVLDFFEQNQVKRGECYLAGNSVHMDKMFLMRYMPRIVEYMHYRIVDSSTLKVLCQMWYPGICDKVPRKLTSHRALDDIRESIDELRFYESALFIKKSD